MGNERKRKDRERERRRGSERESEGERWGRRRREGTSLCAPHIMTVLLPPSFNREMNPFHQRVCVSRIQGASEQASERTRLKPHAGLLDSKGEGQGTGSRKQRKKNQEVWFSPLSWLEGQHGVLSIRQGEMAEECRRSTD